MVDIRDIEKLKWVRILDPVHIPWRLVEQIRDRDFEVDKFYEYQRQVCSNQTPECIVVNPLNLLYVLTDEENLVVGFFWGVIDPLCNSLCINSFSIDKRYWNSGKAIKLLEKHAKEIVFGGKLSKCYWISNCPRVHKKYGFKRSSHIVFEYIPREDDRKDLLQEDDNNYDSFSR